MHTDIYIYIYIYIYVISREKDKDQGISLYTEKDGFVCRYVDKHIDIKRKNENKEIRRK